MNDEPLRVLIVEDEAVLAMQLEMLVEDRGHVVVGTAYSASEAIALARATRPDLAFVDLQLQGRSSGIDVARAIRDMEGVTIVFVTANAAALADDFEGGAAVIAKPFSVALMRNSLPYIEQCVRSRHRSWICRSGCVWLRPTSRTWRAYGPEPPSAP